MNPFKTPGKMNAFPERLVVTKFPFLLHFILLMFCLLIQPKANAKTYPYDDKKDSTMVYEPIPIKVMADGYQDFYIEAFYTSKKTLFVNIEDLFNTLKIACKTGSNGNALSGFIENESKPYLIDFNTRQIKVGKAIATFPNGLIKDQNILYLESSLFAETFGIMMTFNYRELTVKLKANFELPLIKQTRIEKIRNTLSRVQGKQVVDTTLQRNYHLFRFGTVDWSAASAQSWNIANNLSSQKGSGEETSPPQLTRKTIDNQVSIGIGTEFLFGEADFRINYYDWQKFDNRQLYYLWRWVDNDNPVIKQAQLGTISTQTISFLNAPIVGATIRNASTTLRTAKGFYSISDFTGPNWDVELYINDAMVDHTRADATGLYRFKVPNVYGYTTLKLKFYGPMGEERTEERTINVPYTLLPIHEFEYGLTGGFVQDSLTSRFSRGEFNFGVNRFLTFGGGYEYLSSISIGAFIPYLTATIQPFNRLTLFGEYDHGVKTRGLMDYYIGKDMLLELDYAKYVEGQQATRFNAPEERRIKFSFPFKHKQLNGYARFDYTQLLYKGFTFNQSGMMLTANYQRLSANSYTQLNWVGQGTPFFTTDLTLACRLKNSFTIRPSAQYNTDKNMISSYKLEAEKYIPNGILSLSYQRSPLLHDYFMTVNFKYDLNFARTNSAASLTKNRIYTAQSAQGSLAFGGGNRYSYKSNNSSMSKGGISLYPFLDLNYNGKRDPGEPMVNIGNAINIPGGKVISNAKDSVVRIADLTAFTPYIIEFNDNGLGNISWRFKKKTYRVLIDPNQFKRIDIPIVIVAEVNGMVYKQTGQEMVGMGRIPVKIYNKETRKLVGETLSESDGFYSYFGLEPGEYVARVDSARLTDLFLTADPSYKDFKEKKIKEGDIVSNVDFILQSGLNIQMALDIPKPNDTASRIPSQPLQITDTTSLPDIGFYRSPINNISLQGKLNTNKEVPTLQKIANPILSFRDSIPAIEPKMLATYALQSAFIDMVITDTIVRLPGTILYEIRLFSNHSRVVAKEIFLQLFNLIPGIKIMETLDANNVYHYTTGTFMSMEEAQKFLSYIKANGWRSASIRIYTGGNRKIITFKSKKDIANTPPNP
ncbi:MAG: hypothetical protein Q8908_04975 [Bacteroidota bacterium]|nr:hypothetical protein [Bacteroidota bacterium]